MEGLNTVFSSSSLRKAKERVTNYHPTGKSGNPSICATCGSHTPRPASPVNQDTRLRVPRGRARLLTVPAARVGAQRGEVRAQAEIPISKQPELGEEIPRQQPRPPFASPSAALGDTETLRTRLVKTAQQL